MQMSIFPDVPSEYRIAFLAREVDYTREALGYFLSLDVEDPNKEKACLVVEDKRNEFYKMWIKDYDGT